MMLFLIGNRVAAYPKDWDFLKVNGTVTLTGATSYNLKTLLTGYLGLYQVYGIISNAEVTYSANNVANITSAPVYTIKNGILTFSGTAPASGTLRVQYRSQFMVEDSSGTRKKYFENSEDVSVLPDADLNVLIFGVGEYVEWKRDTTSEEKKAQVKGWFNDAWDNLFTRDERPTAPVSML